MPQVIAKMRERKLASDIYRASRIYNQGLDGHAIEQHQLALFNDLWASIQQAVPFYHELVHNRVIPKKIECWEDFSKFPIVERSDIQRNLKGYIDPSQRISGSSSTGGSTGTPISIPRCSTESQVSAVNIWIGRNSYGIQVSDRLLHLWGHSHLFGEGWKKYIKDARRKAKNYLLGYKHISAYDLNTSRLREIGDVILGMRPDYIVGYSRSLALLAKENADRTNLFKELRIKAIVATAEDFSASIDHTVVGDVFGCPVAMEYGAAEAGVIAYTHPDDGYYRVFWDTYLVESIPIDENSAKILLTTLYPRALPLIRYDIGDSIREYSAFGSSVLKFKSLLGRDNDLLELRDGRLIHPEAFTHCIKGQTGLVGLQVIQEKDGSITIHLLAKRPLNARNESLMRRNLSTIHNDLGDVRIEYVSYLEQTIAGKTKWIIRR